MDTDLLSLSYNGNPFREIIPGWLDKFTLDNFHDLRPQFVIVTFLFLTCSIIMKIVKNNDNNVENLARPLITNFIILIVVASAPYWMQQAWKGFVEIARGPLDWQKNQAIVTTISALASFFAAAIPADLNSMSKPTGASIASSIFKGLGYAMTNCAMLVQMMLFILQYVILQVCHLLAPIALACYAFDATKDIGQKFILQTLSIMSWIVGFAIVNMVAMKMASFMLPSLLIGSVAAVATDLVGLDILPSNKPIGVYATVISSILIGGSAMVPIFMQSLFTSGMATAGQAFHPSMAGINGINVAKGQTGGQGMMPGPGGSMVPVPNNSALAGGNTAGLGTNAGAMWASQARRGAADAALNSHAGGNANVHSAVAANNSSTVNVSARSSTAAPALTAGGSGSPQLTMDQAAAQANASGTAGGGVVSSSPGSTSRAAFDHVAAEPTPATAG